MVYERTIRKIVAALHQLDTKLFEFSVQSDALHRTYNTLSSYLAFYNRETFLESVTVSKELTAIKKTVATLLSDIDKYKK